MNINPISSPFIHTTPNVSAVSTTPSSGAPTADLLDIMSKSVAMDKTGIHKQPVMTSFSTTPAAPHASENGLFGESMTLLVGLEKSKRISDQQKTELNPSKVVDALKLADMENTQLFKLSAFKKGLGSLEALVQKLTSGN